jgi:hypothetical protein
MAGDDFESGLSEKLKVSQISASSSTMSSSGFSGSEFPGG